MFCRYASRSLLVAAFLAVFSFNLSLHAAPWLPSGPEGGDARSFAPDPHDHTHLYLGAANGWIFESHDSGASWRRLASVGKRDDLVLDSIVVDGRNSKHLIVGAWVIDRPDGGLFVSNDGGVTWSSQADLKGQSIRALTASASDPSVMVAGTLKGVYRSTDGGQHWKPISPPESTEIHEVESVAIDPKDPNVIYAGTWHLPWKTSNAGEHWDNIKNGIIDDSDVFSIIIDPVNPQTVYASACSGIYKSDDAGLLFKKVQGIPSTARRTRVLLQDPLHLENVFAGTTEGLFRSTDSGKTWARTTGPEIIVNDVSIDASNSSHILLATDRGGILVSEDGGTTFHSSNTGFSSRQVLALRRDSHHPDTLFAGIVNDKEWGGVFASTDGGSAWTQSSQGLQGRDVFALGEAPDGTMIAGTSHGIFRLDADLKAWKRVDEPASASAPPSSSRQPSSRPPAGHPSAPRAHLTEAFARPSVPVGRNQFAKQIEGKSTARAASATAPVASTSRRTAVSKSHSAHGKRRPAAHRATVAPSAPRGFDGSVYAIATAGQTVFATTSLGLRSSADNGLTWSPSVAEGTSDWHYLAAAGKNVVAASLHSVHFSPDAGVTWSPVKLPETLNNIAAVAVEPTGQVWIGGREGVFVSSDGGNSWTTPKNLFVNSVNSIFFDDLTSRLLITTGSNSSLVFTVQLPQQQVSFTDTGWNLRFARPVGDHLVAATLFDGIVIQPKMVASPVAAASSGAH